MSDLPRFVSSVVNVINIFGLIKFSLPQSHLLHEIGMYEVIGSSTVYQCFYVGHVVTCTN